MVQDVDAHDITSTDHPCSEDDVVRAWTGIAGRVVVKQDDRSRRCGRGLSEHLARVDDGAVKRPD